MVAGTRRPPSTFRDLPARAPTLAHSGRIVHGQPLVQVVSVSDELAPTAHLENIASMKPRVIRSNLDNCDRTITRPRFTVSSSAGVDRRAERKDASRAMILYSHQTRRWSSVVTRKLCIRKALLHEELGSEADELGRALLAAAARQRALDLVLDEQLHDGLARAVQHVLLGAAAGDAA